MNVTNNLAIGFLNAADKFPERPALEVEDRVFTYRQLSSMAAFLKKQVQAAYSQNPRFIALLAYRSPAAFAGILGILTSGYGYVPLHPEFPVERNHNILELSGVDVVIVSAECQQAFDILLPRLTAGITFILVGLRQSHEYAKKYESHRFIVVDDLMGFDEEIFAKPVSRDDIAYLLFTSGSTGEPKGVPVSHGNARSYVTFVVGRYELSEYERVSQMHDITFDNSIHDIFVAWEIGACLCVASKQDKLLPVSFIQRKELTLWFSVPSVAVIIDKYGRLEPGIFPTLRYSFFAGEALYKTTAEKWQNAAPNSKIVNTYGPTETTVTISYYDWDSNASPAHCLNGVVPLGRIFEGQTCKVMAADGREAAIDEPGELWLSGSQVTKEYWNNPAQTMAHYVHLPETGDVLWYRSGDLVKKGSDGLLHYLGRTDSQIKIQGNRVELGAIDKVLREVTGLELAVAVPVLVSPGNASEVVAFICTEKSMDEKMVLESCRGQLPKYMVPSKVHFIKEMPLNANGKVDRFQLRRFLEERA